MPGRLAIHPAADWPRRPTSGHIDEPVRQAADRILRIGGNTEPNHSPADVFVSVVRQHNPPECEATRLPHIRCAVLSNW
jgi:hypothetical protein